MERDKTVHLGMSAEQTRKLIRLAETEPWTGELRYALALGCKYRNIAFGSRDSCGDLADALRLSLRHDESDAR